MFTSKISTYVVFIFACICIMCVDVYVCVERQKWICFVACSYLSVYILLFVYNNFFECSFFLLRNLSVYTLHIIL